jgi:hypothetical protein
MKSPPRIKRSQTSGDRPSGDGQALASVSIAPYAQRRDVASLHLLFSGNADGFF